MLELRCPTGSISEHLTRALRQLRTLLP
jgi:hypothetical protein